MLVPQILIRRIVSHDRVFEAPRYFRILETYRSEGTRGHRFAAIKYLPESVAKEPQALARLQSEAQATSAVNIRNFCAICDTGEEDAGACLAPDFLSEQKRSARGC